jgi:hypothetical protein
MQVGPDRAIDYVASNTVAEAHYALDSLPNEVPAAEYRTDLPDEKIIAEELERSQAELQERRLSERPEG